MVGAITSSVQQRFQGVRDAVADEKWPERLKWIEPATAKEAADQRDAQEQYERANGEPKRSRDRRADAQAECQAEPQRSAFVRSLSAA